MANKKLFVNLALEEKHMGNQLGKAFNAVGWENIIKAFNEKRDLNSFGSRTFTNNWSLVCTHVRAW